MLAELMDGRALTSGELARAAAVAPDMASAHLARLSASGLIATCRQGRHQYHLLASAEAARLLRTATALPQRRRAVTGPRDPATRAARTCYGHLAGTLGVKLADALAARGLIHLSAEGGAVTEAGLAVLRGFGLAPDAVTSASCRPCLDWSERQPHVGGPLGKALASRCFALGWIETIAGSRAVSVTPSGLQGFAERFGIAL
jgi:hypothetical protein